MRFRLLLACMLCPLAVVRGDDFEARTFKSTDGAMLPYRLLKPLNYEPAKKYPLVVFLHGAGERGDDNKAQLKHGAATFATAATREKFPCFVLAAQCPKDRRWVEMDWGGVTGTAPDEPGPIQPLLLAALDPISGEFSIDPDRVYVTGLSMGGYGTWDLITRHPGKWAAAVPVCGGGDKTRAAAARAVPVWAFHGLEDNVIQPVRSRDMVAGMKAAGGFAAHTEYPGVQHDSWSLAYSEPNLLPWLFAQQRGQAPKKMELATSSFTALALPPGKVFPGAGALQLAPWFQKLWMKRRVEFARNMDAEKGAVVFLGDSITQGWGALANDFPDIRTANRGISGDTSRGVLYRLKEDVLNVHPRAVNLLIGTNDLALGGTPEQIVENIKAIVAELHKQNRDVPVILNYVMPRGPQPGRFPEAIQELNRLIDEFAKQEPRILVCDTWSIFNDGKGSCRREEFPDMLHPNKEGYAKWKAALAKVFRGLKL